MNEFKIWLTFLLKYIALEKKCQSEKQKRQESTIKTQYLDFKFVLKEKTKKSFYFIKQRVE